MISRRLLRSLLVPACVGAISCGSTPSTAPSPTPTPTPTPVNAFVATGRRAVDALTQAGYAGITISGDGLQTSSSDGSGAFTIAAATPAGDPRLVVFAGPGIVERRTNVRVPGPVALRVAHPFVIRPDRVQRDVPREPAAAVERRRRR